MALLVAVQLQPAALAVLGSSALLCMPCTALSLGPPPLWFAAPPGTDAESKELLTYCIKRVRGMQKVKLVDASFIWTEPHRCAAGGGAAPHTTGGLAGSTAAEVLHDDAALQHCPGSAARHAPSVSAHAFLHRGAQTES